MQSKTDTPIIATRLLAIDVVGRIAISWLWGLVDMDCIERFPQLFKIDES
jgi:hypothetical protein